MTTVSIAYIKTTIIRREDMLTTVLIERQILPQSSLYSSLFKFQPAHGRKVQLRASFTYLL